MRLTAREFIGLLVCGIIILTACFHDFSKSDAKEFPSGDTQSAVAASSPESNRGN